MVARFLSVPSGVTNPHMPARAKAGGFFPSSWPRLGPGFVGVCLNSFLRDQNSFDSGSHSEVTVFV